MKVIKIDSNNKKDLDDFRTELNNSHVFVLMHMEHCGPCKMTVPLWDEIPKQLKDSFEDAILASVEQKVCAEIGHKAFDVNLFPTIKYIYKQTVEDYKGNKSTQEFINWITKKLSTKQSLLNLSNIKYHRGIIFQKKKSNHVIDKIVKTNRSRSKRLKSQFHSTVFPKSKSNSRPRSRLKSKSKSSSKSKKRKTYKK